MKKSRQLVFGVLGAAFLVAFLFGLCVMTADVGATDTKPPPINSPSDFHAKYKYPDNFKFVFDSNGLPIKGIYYLTEINNVEIRNVISYMMEHNVKTLMIDIFSPGGSVIAAMDILGYMRAFEDWGGIVETRVLGMAASGGFIIFVGGTPGHRTAAQNANLMFHQISLKEFSFGAMSYKDVKDLLDFMKYLQDTCIRMLSKRSYMTEKEIYDRINNNKEFWMTGEQALEFGFADKILIPKSN